MRSKVSSSFFAIIAICLAVLGTLAVPSLRADEENKKTIMTFNEDVQVPGTVLPAGTYVFKLADSDSDRTIVQIFNADETHLITTILAIPDYRMQTPDKTIVKFDERPAGQPEAIRSWFYPGDNYGVEFVYPRQKAVELAQANKSPVLSTRDELTDTATMKSTPVEPVSPPPAPAPVVEVDKTELAEIDAVIAPPAELPASASSLPLIVVCGTLLLVAAIGVRRFAALTR